MEETWQLATGDPGVPEEGTIHLKERGLNTLALDLSS